MTSLQEIQKFTTSPAFSLLGTEVKKEMKVKERQLIIDELRNLVISQISSYTKKYGEPIHIKMSLEPTGQVFIEDSESASCKVCEEISDTPILSHQLDWSPFEYGFVIDRKYHEVILKALGREVPKGGQVPVIVEYEGESFSAVIDNPAVKNRKDTVIRLLYRGKRTLGDKLKENFQETYQYIKHQKEINGGRFRVKLPEDLKATIHLYSKEVTAEFKLDCKK